MFLKELIRFLEHEDASIVVPLGFSNPHSYRGYYNDLAFSPDTNVTVGAMLASAKEANGTTYPGWKGGDYTMHEYTDVWLANKGECGEGIGPTLLRLMIDSGDHP